MRYIVGTFLILVAALIFLATYGPVVKEEIRYDFDRALNVRYAVGTEQLSAFEKPLTPPNTDFSIIIPKIAAVAPIVDKVDAENPDSYLPALMKGVAHARDTAYPGQDGNVYLFAHSTNTFYNVGIYNAVFYLIGKLEKGDEVDIFYQGQRYTYQVFDKRVVDPKAPEYFQLSGEDLGEAGGKALTLQTCYPPGTTLRRLVVLARQVD